jgi:sec-independent protein translocase protein TatC
MPPEHDVRMPLTAHLEELRWRIVKSLGAAVVGFALCYGFAEPLVKLLIAPLQALRPDIQLLIGTGVGDAFFTKLKVSFVAGVFLSSPVIFYQVWQFIAPGLYERERRVALPFALAGSFFFMLGGLFCYRLVLPIAFEFFLSEYGSIDLAPQIRISEYVSFVSSMLLAFGVTFQLPVASFFLARVGIITHRTLIDWGRYAIVTIFVVSAVLTPGADVASMLLMAGPLLVLYGASIGVAWMVARPAAAASSDPSETDEAAET